jgi:ectoine hydroxylase-related dioxygenase (phytanoyl-CoA dioxygenase family)
MSLLAAIIRSLPLNPVRSGLREIWDYFHYRPLFQFKAKDIVRGGFSSLAVAESLRAQGICILENVLDRERLLACRAELDSFFVDSEGKAVGLTDVPGTYSRQIGEVQHSVFVELILDEMVLAAVEAYYARPIYVAEVQANRLEPVERYEGDSYQWHHDMKGKYVKAMWLLTDVSKEGQRMSYIAGSHRIKHRAARYEESRFTEAQARAYGEVVECVAPAGSVVVFDTNGIHRGNRNQGPRRDVVFGAYSAGRYRLGCRLDVHGLGHLTEWQQGILQRSRTPSQGGRR